MGDWRLLNHVWICHYIWDLSGRDICCWVHHLRECLSWRISSIPWWTWSIASKRPWGHDDLEDELPSIMNSWSHNSLLKSFSSLLSLISYIISGMEHSEFTAPCCFLTYINNLSDRATKQDRNFQRYFLCYYGPFSFLPHFLLLPW